MTNELTLSFTPSIIQNSFLVTEYHANPFFISMQTLANIAEIELSQIYRIEIGKINPKLTTILKIATALGVEAKELF